jgi:hypothetical protein
MPHPKRQFRTDGGRYRSIGHLVYSTLYDVLANDPFDAEDEEFLHTQADEEQQIEEE